MRRVIVATVAAVCLSIGLPVMARDTARTTYASGPWRIDARLDRFTNVRTCSITTRKRHGRLSLVALALRPLGHANVETAWVKVDGGAARPWRDDLPELARRGVEIDGRDMIAPTDGWLWLPLERLTMARVVEVRVAPGKRVRRFDVHGIAEALNAARASGCRDGDFVR